MTRGSSGTRNLRDLPSGRFTYGHGIEYDQAGGLYGKVEGGSIRDEEGVPGRAAPVGTRMTHEGRGLRVSVRVWTSRFRRVRSGRGGGWSRSWFGSVGHCRVVWGGPSLTDFGGWGRAWVQRRV